MMKREEYEKPFVEKYRPQVLDDVVGNTLAVDQLKAISQKGNLPNIIIVVSLKSKSNSRKNLRLKFRVLQAQERHQV